MKVTIDTNSKDERSAREISATTLVEKQRNEYNVLEIYVILLLVSFVAFIGWLKSPPTGTSVFFPENSGRVEVTLDLAKMDFDKSYRTSEKFGGLEWTLDAKKNKRDGLEFFLFCRPLLHSDDWAADVEVKFSVSKQVGKHHSFFFRHRFNNATIWGSTDFSMKMERFITLTADVTILQAENILGHIPRVPHFDKHVSGQTDACLIVDGENFFVSYTMLAAHSTRFANVLTGTLECSTFSWIDQSVTASSFRDMLMVIYAPERLEKVRDLEGLLRVADVFGAESVRSRCGSLLMKEGESGGGRSLASRLRLASKFNLPETNDIVAQIKTLSEMENLESTEEWKEITWKTRAALLTRLFELRR